MKCSNCNQDIPESSPFCPYCGAKQVPLTKGKTYSAKVVYALIALLFVTIIADPFIIRNLEKKHQEEVQIVKKQYEELAKENEENEILANEYSVIINALSKNSDDRFSVSNYIIPLRENIALRVRLNTNFLGNQDYTVSYNYYGTSAEIEFTEEHWENETDLKVIPKEKGITWFEFYNSENDKTFNMIVIVF